MRILLTGRVLAVSRTSITIGGVKVGDEVAAQITGTPTTWSPPPSKTQPSELSVP